MPFLPPNQQCQSTEGKRALRAVNNRKNKTDNSVTQDKQNRS